MGLAEAFGSPLQPSYRGNPDVSDLLLRDYNRNQPLTVEPMPLPNQSDKTELTPLTTPMAETMSGLGAYYNQLSGPTTLEEAFAQPPATPTTLEEAFAQPIQSSVTIEQSIQPVIEIEGASVPLPESHFELSEEEQSKAIENIAEYIKQKRAENQKFEESVVKMREQLEEAPTPEESLDEYGKDLVGGFPGFFPGAMAGAKALSALAPHPLLKGGLGVIGGIGGGLAGSSVTGPYVRAVTDPMVDGAKDFINNETVFGKQGVASLGGGTGVPSVIDNSMVPYETYDSSSTGVLPPTALRP